MPIAGSIRTPKPMKHSSGGRSRLGRISCRGDGYLRTLLIRGARSSLQRAKAVSWENATPEQRWIQDLERRLPFGKMRVAIANKHARRLWAMLARAEQYDAEALAQAPDGAAAGKTQGRRMIELYSPSARAR